jgi:hypothetical protein
MEVPRCSCSVLGCNQSLLDSVSQAGRQCQELSPRSVSSGAALSLAALVAVEVRDAPTHPCHVALLDVLWQSKGVRWLSGGWREETLADKKTAPIKCE